MEEEGGVKRETIEERHKRERKQLQAKIQKLKNSVPKGDKKKKKEVTMEIAILENEMDTKHEKELNEFQQNNEELVEQLDKINVGQKVSKTQKKKAKKAQKEAEKEERMRQGEGEGGGERKREALLLFNKLSERNLVIKPIPSDGHCLYAALVHQLSLNGMQTSVASLRSDAANQMRRNVDHFLPFFINEQTGEIFSEKEFMDYCDKVEKTSEWGGQAELHALSEKLGACIEIIQAEGAPVYLGNKDNLHLIVTYHRHAYGLGEHYNSVEKIGQEKN